MYGGWIAVRTITYLLRGPPRQCRCRSVRTTVIRPPCLSIRKILPTTGYSSVGDVDNSVSSRAQKQNSTLICYWASAGVGRTIRFANSVAGHARGIDQQLPTPAEGHEMTRVNALLTSLVAISVSLL